MDDNSAEISITLNPKKLAIISIPRNEMKEYSYELMKFFISEEKPFYSLTIYNSEISLVIEEDKYLTNFPKCNVKKDWYALFVNVGASSSGVDLVNVILQKKTQIREIHKKIYRIPQFKN